MCCPVNSCLFLFYSSSSSHKCLIKNNSFKWKKMAFERYLKRNKSISSFSYSVMFFFFIPQFGSYFRILSNKIVMNNQVEHLVLNFKNKDTRQKEGQRACVFGIPIASLKYILVRFRGVILYQQKEKVFNEWH